MNTYQVLITLLVVIVLQLIADELARRININLTGLTPFLKFPSPLLNSSYPVSNAVPRLSPGLSHLT